MVTEWTPIIIGCITTFIIGFVTLKLFLKMLKANKIHYFAPYCFMIGIIAIALYF